jgi:hypothetical protein
MRVHWNPPLIGFAGPLRTLLTDHVTPRTTGPYTSDFGTAGVKLRPDSRNNTNYGQVFHLKHPDGFEKHHRHPAPIA